MQGSRLDDFTAHGETKKTAADFGFLFLMDLHVYFRTRAPRFASARICRISAGISRWQ